MQSHLHFSPHILENIGVCYFTYLNHQVLEKIKHLATESKFGNKNSFAKKSEHSKENSPPQAKKFLGFAKRFSEFAKGIYETCNRNFFNLTLIIAAVVFAIAQFILSLHFASNN